MKFLEILNEIYRNLMIFNHFFEITQSVIPDANLKIPTSLNN